MLSIFVYMFRILKPGHVNGEGDLTFDSLRIVLLAGLIGFLLNAFFIDSMMLRHFWLFMAFIVIFGKLRIRRLRA